MFTTILFDFDGTIADTFEAASQILIELAVPYHYRQPTKQEIMQMRGMSVFEVCKQLDIPLRKVPFLLQKAQKILNQHIIDIYPFPEVVETIFSLKREGYELGIISSNSEKNIKKFLFHHHLAVFDAIYSSTSIFGKARVLDGFLKKHHVAKDQVIYIGDEIRDVEAAKQIGIHHISVAWGFNTKESLAKLRPDYLIEEPGQIVRIIQKLNE